MRARDYRRVARESLRGNWPTAIGAGIIASLLGAAISTRNGGGGAVATDEEAMELGQMIRQVLSEEVMQILLGILSVLIVIAVAYLMVTLVLGGAVTLGYAQFNLNLIDGNAELGDVFSHLRRLWEGFLMQFFRTMMVFLWSLLLVIPGIIASYRYILTPYILAENHELSVMEAITESKLLMKGHKWEMFCMELSFIGWQLLGILTFGIGLLWVNPYIEASRAAFYRQLQAGT